MSASCPICRSDKTQKIRDSVKAGPPKIGAQGASKPALGFPQVLIDVYRCRECVLDFLYTWDDEEKASEFYRNNNYVYRPNLVEGHKKRDELEIRFERVKPFITPDTRLLDIGCGDGSFLKKIRPFVKSAEGMEITSAHVDNLRSEGIVIWDCLLKDFNPSEPYDAVCMHALLEHIPNISRFLEDLKKIIRPNASLFIEVPNVRDPLSYYYRLKTYQEFFYREYHLYYFSEISLKKILSRHGFHSEIRPILMASITNHFHWMHHGKGQENTNSMVNVVLPMKDSEEIMPDGNELRSLFEKVDDVYREEMTKAGIGDLLACRAWLE